MNKEILEKLKYIGRNPIINGEIEENVLYDDEAKEILQYVEKLNKEIERLNNIINELEKWCLSWKENDKYCYLASNDKDKCRYDIWEEVLDKLQELKGNNNEKDK